MPALPRMHRLFFPLSVAVIALAGATSSRAVERLTVDHEYVKKLAAERAARAYEQPHGEVPKFFRDMNYDNYRRIRFIPEQSLWRAEGLPFQIQFYHPGYLYTQQVRMNEFTDTHVQEIPFTGKSWDYQDLKIQWFSRWRLGYAGFRVLHPVNTETKWDELVSFIGASYFRALGKGHRYGISARGLAINSGGPEKEEFPAFTEFWLRKPAADAKAVFAHALLEGPSVTGAFEMTITPGTETVMDVRATFYFRKELPGAGFGPMSSMFWFGEGSSNRFNDFRPEVHDSDGLLVAPDSHTRLWRPLLNPPSVTLSDYPTPKLAGFGLLQRDRDFRSYEDLEAGYERRPGLWVEPVGDWPPGRVRLVEIPAKDEYHDNIAVFWMPDAPPPPGQPYELKWRLRWTSTPKFGGPAGWVRATRVAPNFERDGWVKYVIDFDHNSMAAIPQNAELRPEVELEGDAKVEHQHVFFNPHDRSRRLVLILASKKGVPPVTVRARLMQEGQPATETWTTKWQP